MNKFNKLYESLIAQQAPKDSVLRDVQIANTYIWLVKSGNTYKVKKGSGDDINRTTMKTLKSFKDENSARDYYHKIRKEVMDSQGI